MRHQTERKRGGFNQLGWSCVTCRQWWTRDPTSSCPGVPAYGSWDDAQKDGLRTQTQWKAERRNVIVSERMARGAMMRGAAHPSEWYWLYSEDQTTPMRAAPRKRQGQQDGGEAER